MLDTIQYLLGAGSGVLVGFVLGLVGGGGSILAVPLMVYLVGVPSPHVAIGTSALAVAANALTSLVNHVRQGNVKWRCALVFAIAGVAGAFAGSSAGKAFDGQKLLFLFAIVMIVVGVLMLRNRKRKGDPSVVLGRDNATKLVGYGLGTGLFSGFFGIGGGFLIVPGLVAATGMPMISAVGSSLVAVSAFGLTTAANYALSGLVDWGLAAAFIFGGVAGGFLGARLAKRLSATRGRLTTVFAGVIFAVAAYTLWKSAGALGTISIPEVVTIGPFAFPLERLLAAALTWGFLAASLWMVGRESGRTRQIPWLALAIGLVVARLSFVIANWDTFGLDPATVAYLWQGGFDTVAGIAAAAIVLVFGIRRSRKVGGAMLALAVTTAIWFGYLHLEAARPRLPFPLGVRITDLEGRAVSMGDFHGRPFIVNLWASWCGPCRREMPMLVEAAAEMPNVPILLVNEGEDPHLIRRFLRDEGLPREKVLSDRGAVLMRLTESRGLPTTLFVDASGRIEEAHVGELSKATLLSEIRNRTKDPR